ncbi:iron chelate uptake ABC transporter family permease subunit [Proteiniclasticum sp. QWL-01]|uniref:ABC transporter permease n=1 Tax=Proteiniclasticum sp. QWL-01 TaxID=3036945 RepID=UPI00220D0645|nr:iron chelate uptake ABC transporter family permease subunit [Proteiniclasticum sp. QWL-01]UUM11067.1 iron chelate uptake ABC transporter family permease subunit [Clostridiaceae bacterium HFYG-1003]WFF72397.1 iron chelate uptake ABC transporter family permease subunit [Proteiniclasticum sp. QWL-01]
MKNHHLILLLLPLALLSLFIGARPVRPAQLLQGGETELFVFALSRVPRLASILLTGSALSISGLILQQITRNKFVSPSTAATMDSARMGILFAMIVLPGASTMTKMGIAFAFALAGTFLFLVILGRIKAKSVIVIPLVGIMLGNLIDSVTTFFAYRQEVVQNMNSWLQGSFAMVTRGRYEIIFLVLPLFGLALFYANQFTIAGLGEDMARNLGLRYRLVVNVGLAIVAMISSAVLVTVGNIPFIGLIIPNLVSLVRGDHVKNNLWTTALLGALFVLACDVVGRVLIFPYEISISLTAGVAGSMIFLLILARGGKRI